MTKKTSWHNLFQPRILILLFFVFVSVFLINYNPLHESISIAGVTRNSPAFTAGIQIDPTNSGRSLEQLTSLNGYPVSSFEDLYNALQIVDPEADSLLLTTSKNPAGYTIPLENITPGITLLEDLGIRLIQSPQHNIRYGIELAGGSRIILSVLNNTSVDFDTLIDNLQSRLDIYGASGTRISKITDAFSEQQFIMVESASANKDEIYNLIKNQGKFDAKFGNTTVFTGSNIIAVFTDAQHSNFQGCFQSGTNALACRFGFQVAIDEKGQNAFFDAVQNIPVEGDQLAVPLDFYLDDTLYTSLSVSEVFKTEKISSPLISVTGDPALTEQQARQNVLAEAKRLQAVLRTETLPVSLDIEQSYNIVSSSGEAFLQNALLVGLVVLLAIAAVIAFRYKHPFIFFAISSMLLAELIIVLGISAFLKLTIDLAAIGGLIAALGTGVDDQIIIIDEITKKHRYTVTQKKRFKKAFGIIVLTYFTTLAAMLPLSIAGLKLLQGFAVMIILGVTVGILLTRPAFASLVKSFYSVKH